MCVLCVAKYDRNRLDIAWYLIESISISNGCDARARTSLVAAARPFPVVSPGLGEVEGLSTMTLTFSRSIAMGWVYSLDLDPSDPARGCVDNVIPLEIQQVVLRSPLKWQG